MDQFLVFFFFYFCKNSKSGVSLLYNKNRSLILIEHFLMVYIYNNKKDNTLFWIESGMKNLIRLRFFFAFPLKYTIVFQQVSYQVLIYSSLSLKKVDKSITIPFACFSVTQGETPTNQKQPQVVSGLCLFGSSRRGWKTLLGASFFIY